MFLGFRWFSFAFLVLLRFPLVYKPLATVWPTLWQDSDCIPQMAYVRIGAARSEMPKIILVINIANIIAVRSTVDRELPLPIQIL